MRREKRRDKRDESLESGIRWKERQEQRKIKAVVCSFQGIKRRRQGEN
jgi:hypothetical protein